MPRKKYCNYCKNHDIEVLETGHGRPCPTYNNAKHLKGCLQCRQTAKKTATTRRHRQSNRATRGRGNNNVYLLKKDIHEYLAFKNDLAKSDSLSLMVYPYNYPQIILYENTVNDLNNLIDSQQSTKDSSCFQLRIEENGAWKVVCINEETRDRFMQLVKNIWITGENASYKCPLFAVPENDTFKHLILSCILDEPITCNQFLLSVASKNSFQTSRWLSEDSQPQIDGGHKVIFAVDPIVFRYMLTSNLIFRVNDRQVQAKLEFNPFLVYMFDEC